MKLEKKKEKSIDKNNDNVNKKEQLLKNKLDNNNKIQYLNIQIEEQKNKIKKEQNRIKSHKKRIEVVKYDKNILFQKVSKLEEEIHKISNTILNEKENIEKFKNEQKKSTQARKINLLLEITDLEKILNIKKKIFKNIS